MALVATLAVAAPWPWRFAYADGDPVGVQGTVHDDQGRPIAGLEVAIEASGPHFDWKSLSRVRGEVERHVTHSASDGAFVVDWSWTNRFHHFELVVSLDDSVGHRSLRRELSRQVISDQLAHGSPVAAALVVEAAPEVERLRAFLAAIDTDDEKRVWEELGMPESVETDDTVTPAEISWWYFGAGRVARFADGRLLELQEFAPVGTPGPGAGR